MRGLNVKILLPVCLILIASTIAIADDYVDGEVIVKCTEELVGFGSDPPSTGNQELDAVIEENRGY